MKAEKISLKYGEGTIFADIERSRFETLTPPAFERPLSDAEIGDRLSDPLGTPPLEDKIKPGQTILLVVPDATRQTACGQVANLLVRRLIAAGVQPFDIRIIFATGIHRKVTAKERGDILTPFIAQRIKTIDHEPRDLMRIIDVGESKNGYRIELNRSLFEHDHVVLIGGVGFHYFAGFGGGRKLICPGLASAKTIRETHRLALDRNTLTRADGVGTGLLNGNAVHDAFIEAAKFVPNVFSISTITDDSGRVTSLYCGDLDLSHRAACEHFAAQHTITIAERRPLVIVGCGGVPHDINLIQAHKALEAAANACCDGGRLIFVAECGEGLGRSDLLSWFTAIDSRALAEELRDHYQVNGQTAWSLLQKTERFDVRMVTALDEETLQRMRIRKASSVNEALPEDLPGYIIPAGSAIKIDVNSP